MSEPGRRTAIATGVVLLALVVAAIVFSIKLSQNHGESVEDQDATKTQPTAPPASAAVDSSILAGGGQGDYVVFDNPAQLAADRDLVVTGTIDSYATGYSVVEELPDMPRSYRDETLVVRVAVDHLFKGTPFTEDGEQYVYVSLPRGVEMIDLNGKPVGTGPSTITPVADYERAIPPGTRVVVIASASPYSLRDGEGTVLNAHAGYPDGAALLSGGHPQTFTVEAAAHSLMSGWDRTYDQMVNELEDAFN